MASKTLYLYKSVYTAHQALYSGGEFSISSDSTSSVATHIGNQVSVWFDASPIANLDIKTINSVTFSFQYRASKNTSINYSYFLYKLKVSGVDGYKLGEIESSKLPTSWTPITHIMKNWTKAEICAGDGVHLYLDIYMAVPWLNTSTAYLKDVKLIVDYTLNSYALTVNATAGGTVTGGGTYESGKTATLTATAASGYRFVKWNEDGNTNATRTVTVTSNATYTAQFEKILYTATFKNYDGTVLQTVTAEHGSTPSYTGATPTKAQDTQYFYSFNGWSPSVGAIIADTIYVAQYTATLRKYTVRWYNEDGTLLETDSTEYGNMPTYDGVVPTKPATAEFTYTFKGWHIEVATVTGNIDYYARYTETTNKYTVLWKNYDGTVLETDSTEYGKIPTYDGATPIRASTAKYTYTFFGWDTTIEEVMRDVVYIAVYTETINEYTVNVSANEGGTATGTGTYKYDSIVTLVASANGGYKFSRWSDGVTDISRTVTVTGDSSYIAIFEPIYITYDTVFNYQKWKANGITSNNGVVSYITDVGFTLTSDNEVAKGTASSLYFSVENGKSYKVDIDIDGEGWDVYFFFCDSNGVWDKHFSDGANRFSSNGTGNSSRVFTIPNDLDIVKAQIRCDANGSNNTVSFSNFRIYPADYYYMGSTIDAEDRSNAAFWDVPTPKRNGYEFVGWNTVPDGSGITYTSTSTFPTDDTVLYSQWIDSSKVYRGTQKLTIYCGVKKISAYCGTQKLT